MYLLCDKGSCGVTYMTMTMNWPWSELAVLKNNGKVLSIKSISGTEIKFSGNLSDAPPILRTET